MILKTEKKVAINNIKPNGRKRNRRTTFYIIECDHCKIIFERALKPKTVYQFCSKACSIESNKVGILASYANEQHTKYMSEHQLEWLESIKQSNLIKYGVEWSWQHPAVQAKRKNTLLDRYGVDHNFKMPECIAKREETFLKIYGHINPINHNEDVINKSKATLLARYGAEHISQTEYFIEKCKQTSQQHYGTDSPMQSDIVKSKFDFHTMWKKAHETKKKNGTYKSSRKENEFHSSLSELFISVVRQETINYVGNNMWSIDFYIEDIDTYIQFDGAYWHGLDRPLEEIKNSNSERDKRIYEGYIKDRAQDEWFRENNLKLIRITDKQFIESKDKISFIQEIISNRAKSNE